jgi:hypothetical protein
VQGEQVVSPVVVEVTKRLDEVYSFSFATSVKTIYKKVKRKETW